MSILKKILVFIITWESRIILCKYKPFIVAVTGSVGKTSTKDAMYDVLKNQGGFVRKSDKSMNSEIGLPLTIIGVPNAWHSLSGWFDNISVGMNLILKREKYPDTLVLEIGADHPGDIRRVTKWLKPDISVVTRVSRTPVHVEFFDSPEDVLEEKAFLATAVKSGGTLILFGDDNNTLDLGERVKDRGVSVVSFGLGEKSMVRGANFHTVYEGLSPEARVPVGISFDLTMDGASQPINISGIAGDTYMYPLLAAAAVGRAKGVAATSIAKSLSAYNPPRGRMNIIQGMNGSTIIDDSYNSSPDAALSALKVLKSLELTGTKYAVLGDMMELGKFTSSEHRKVGQEVVEIFGASSGLELVTVGQRSRLTSEDAVKFGLSPNKVKSFDSSLEAAEYLRPLVKAGDVILVKGSQSGRMERISAALLREPEKAAKLLVRQEKEWLEKA